MSHQLYSVILNSFHVQFGFVITYFPHKIVLTTDLLYYCSEFTFVRLRSNSTSNKKQLLQFSGTRLIFEGIDVEKVITN